MASIAEKKTVSKLLFKTLRELLEATKTAIAQDESSASGMDVDNIADKNSSSNLRYCYLTCVSGLLVATEPELTL